MVQDPRPALESLFCLETILDLGVDAFQLVLDLLQPFLVELLGHGGAHVLAAVGDRDPILDRLIVDLGRDSVSMALEEPAAAVAIDELAEAVPRADYPTTVGFGFRCSIGLLAKHDFHQSPSHREVHPASRAFETGSP